MEAFKPFLLHSLRNNAEHQVTCCQWHNQTSSIFNECSLLALFVCVGVSSFSWLSGGPVSLTGSGNSRILSRIHGHLTRHTGGEYTHTSHTHTLTHLTPYTLHSSHTSHLTLSTPSHTHSTPHTHTHTHSTPHTPHTLHPLTHTC